MEDWSSEYLKQIEDCECCCIDHKSHNLAAKCETEHNVHTNKGLDHG